MSLSRGQRVLRTLRVVLHVSAVSILLGLLFFVHPLWSGFLKKPAPPAQPDPFQ